MVLTASTAIRWQRSLDWNLTARQTLLAAIGKASARHDDDRNLANRLFVTATERIEDAVEIAVARQSARRTPTRISDHGRRL